MWGVILSLMASIKTTKGKQQIKLASELRQCDMFHGWAQWTSLAMKILSGAEGKWQENTSTQEPTVSALHMALGQILVQRKQQTNKNSPRKVLFFEEKLNQL